MNCRRIAMLGGSIALLLGLAVGLVAATPGASTPSAGGSSTPSLQISLESLQLSDLQKRRISELVAEAATDLEQLGVASRRNARRLRAAELDRPFDSRYVNGLVERQAVLMAHVRGTESRVVSEIGALLSEQQLARFKALRAVAETPGTDLRLDRRPGVEPGSGHVGPAPVSPGESGTRRDLVTAFHASPGPG